MSHQLFRSQDITTVKHSPFNHDNVVLDNFQGVQCHAFHSETIRYDTTT